MKTRIYKILFIFLLIIALVLLGLIIRKYVKRSADEKENKRIVEEFLSTSVEENGETVNLKMYGYEVIGIVTIPKIEIQYPILGLETSNPEETKEPMKFAIVRYWGRKC